MKLFQDLSRAEGVPDVSLAAVDQIGWQPIDYAAANGQLEMANCNAKNATTRMAAATSADQWLP